MFHYPAVDHPVAAIHATQRSNKAELGSTGLPAWQPPLSGGGSGGGAIQGGEGAPGGGTGIPGAIVNNTTAFGIGENDTASPSAGAWAPARWYWRG